jgi:hypothetical protein
MVKMFSNSDVAGALCLSGWPKVTLIVELYQYLTRVLSVSIFYPRLRNVELVIFKSSHVI